MSHQEQIVQYVLNDLSSEESSLATLIHMMYSTQYCVTNEQDQVKWYKRTDKGWYSSSSVNYEVKLKMATEVVQLLMTQRGNIVRQRIQNNDQNDTRIRTFLAIEKNLYSNVYKERMLKECATLFLVDELPKD